MANEFSLVVNPRWAEKEVKPPVLQWDNEKQNRRAVWRARITGTHEHPEVQLNRTLQTGVGVVARLSIGDQIQIGDRILDAGVVITTNGKFQMQWKEFYEFVQAVEEASERLQNLQQDLLEELAENLGDSGE